jgi:hypothetical protein
MTVGSRSSSCVERGQPPPCRRGEARSHKVRCVGSGSARAPRQSPGAAPPTSASAPRPCSPQAPWPPSRMSVLRVAAPRQASQHKVSSHPEGRRRSPRRSRAGGDQRGRGARQRALGRRAGRTARGGARARGGGLGGTPEASRAAARRRAPRRHRSGGVHHHELRSPRKLVALYRQERARDERRCTRQQAGRRGLASRHARSTATIATLPARYHAASPSRGRVAWLRRRGCWAETRLARSGGALSHQRSRTAPSARQRACAPAGCACGPSGGAWRPKATRCRRCGAARC